MQMVNSGDQEEEVSVEQRGQGRRKGVEVGLCPEQGAHLWTGEECSGSGRCKQSRDIS